MLVPANVPIAALVVLSVTVIVCVLGPAPIPVSLNVMVSFVTTETVVVPPPVHDVFPPPFLLQDGVAPPPASSASFIVPGLPAGTVMVSVDEVTLQPPALEQLPVPQFTATVIDSAVAPIKENGVLMRS